MASYDSESEFPEEGEATEELETMPKRRVYVVVALFLVAVIVLGTIFTIFASGRLGTWGQQITITHSPITKAYAGEKIEIRAEVIGDPENVTLSYLVNPNNRTEIPYRTLTWSNVYMLLVGAGGEEYSYTIHANEVIGDVYYYIKAAGEYGQSKAEPIRKISISDFYVEVSDSELEVYTDKPGSTKVSIKSINEFEREVSLKVIDLPGGLIAEFNPSTVSLAGGAAESTLEIRMASDQYVPGGHHAVSVKGESVTYALGTTMSIARESKDFTVTVPDFTFTISPTSQEVKKSEITGTTKEKIVSYDIDLTLRYGFQGNLSLNVAGLPSEGADHRFILTNDEFLVTGTTDIELQVIVKPGAPTGAYTLTVSIVGEGHEREKLVTLSITGTYLYR